MRKRDLLQIPISEKTEPDQEKKYQIYAKRVVIKKEKILALDVYYSANETASFRIFITKNNYISLDCNHAKWSEKEIYSLLGWYAEAEIDDISAKEIRLFTGTKKSSTIKLMIVLRCYQDKIREARLIKRDRAITDPIDNRMKQVPRPPKDFSKWINKTAMYESQYIFYHYSTKKDTTGWCSACRKEVSITIPKHGSKGICPACGKNITYRSWNKQKYIHDHKITSILQKVTDGYVLRFFDTTRKHEKEEDATKWSSRTNFFERERVFFSPELKQKEIYRWGSFKQRTFRWNEASYVIGANITLYHANLKEILKGTQLEHSGMDILAGSRPGFDFSVHKFIEHFKDNVYLEYLIKNRLYDMARELVNHYMDCCSRAYQNLPVNIFGKKLKELLRVEKYDIPFLVQGEANLTGLSYLQKQRKKGSKPIMEHMQFIQKTFHDDMKQFDQLTQYAKPGKLIKYFKQSRCFTPKSLRKWIRMYQDYLDMAKKLKYDLSNDFVLFPKQLKLRHDQCVEAIREQDNAKKRKEENRKNKNIAKRCAETQKQYGYTYKGLMTIAPKDAADITREGHELHHCVGTYTKKVAAGETTILFIRKAKEPDTPYFTLEVKDNKVTQCRGKFNCAMPPEVQAFLKSFKSKVLKESNKEERKVS